MSGRRSRPRASRRAIGEGSSSGRTTLPRRRIYAILQVFLVSRPGLGYERRRGRRDLVGRIRLRDRLGGGRLGRRLRRGGGGGGPGLRAQGPPWAGGAPPAAARPAAGGPRRGPSR